MSLLIYALGGGTGHLSRAIALARYANRDGVRVRILSNSPHAATLLRHARTWIDKRQTHFDLLPQHRLPKAIVPLVHAWLRQWSASALVVDTFPRGLGGELAHVLPSLGMAKVLIARDLNPEYVESPQISECIQAFDVILEPGESSPLCSQVTGFRTAPWFVCEPAELRGRDAARGVLKVNATDRRPLIGVVGSGHVTEVTAMMQVASQLREALAERAAVRFVGWRRETSAGAAWQVRHWPLLELHAGVDLLVGAGGYHTVYEARATRTPLFAIPRKRLYDRQGYRLRPEERVSDEGQLRARVLEWRASWSNTAMSAHDIAYSQGAREAYGRLRTLLSKSLHHSVSKR